LGFPAGWEVAHLNTPFIAPKGKIGRQMLQCPDKLLTALQYNTKEFEIDFIPLRIFDFHIK